ncbi:hypothetical protein [Fischerella sp. PCC 9605]|uniref:hypothetical protein n=1 Tax=Fischerella sp. PCC 9605 TaxID=1173024 RepID=UPI00047E8E67|nr:hypothetical protein [Fischerella sp. PCC 9605]
MSVEKKDARLSVRISPQELQEIKDFADENGLAFTDFVLGAIRDAMHKKPESEEFVALVRRVAALEKTVYKQSQAA